MAPRHTLLLFCANPTLELAITIYCYYYCMHICLDEFTTEEYWKEEDTTTYSVEDAVDHMGFGRFQLKVLAISGLFSVSLVPFYSLGPVLQYM